MIRDFILWDIGSLWIPTQYGVLDLGSERISCLIAKEDLWSQWICRQTVRVGSMIQTDPGSRSFGSDPGIHFRDPWACLVGELKTNEAYHSKADALVIPFFVENLPTPFFGNVGFVKFGTFSAIREKTSGGGGCTNSPPVRARDMKWRRSSRATKLLSRILKILKTNKKISNVFLFETVSPQIKTFRKP